MDLHTHWETIYRTRTPADVSWTQDVPARSLKLIEDLAIDRSSRIIDVGGGDSRLVDCLLEAHYTDLSVLDISEAAIDRARARLGTRAHHVTWIAQDIRQFEPSVDAYDLWHDRAVFHFLTEKRDIERYVEMVARAVQRYLIIATFSESGPPKCSGLPVTRYSTGELVECFAPHFDCLVSLNEDHTTPFDTRQNFSWTVLRRT